MQTHKLKMRSTGALTFYSKFLKNSTHDVLKLLTGIENFLIFFLHIMIREKEDK